MDKRTQEWNPGTILELSGKYWASFALHTGVELGIFTLLDEEGMTVEEIASELGISRRGAKAMVSALTAMGLLEREGDIYFDSREAVEYLSKGSPEYLGYMIKHHHYLSKSWAQLPKAVRSGAPVKESIIHDPEPGELEAFLMGMFNNASAMAPRVAEMVNLSGRKALLDLGGGPGTYAIHFCLRNPGLSAKIYDLPQTRPFAENVISGFGLRSRVEFVPFDFTREELTEKFDAVWLSHILHGEGEAVAAGIVGKAASALEPGGEMFVHEFILEDEGDGPLFPALFSLNMLVGTKDGKSYTVSELTGMMERASVGDVTMMDFCGPSQSRILKGRKK